MKKILSVLLALVMLSALCVPAFAQDPATIATISERITANVEPDGEIILDRDVIEIDDPLDIVLPVKKVDTASNKTGTETSDINPQQDPGEAKQEIKSVPEEPEESKQKPDEWKQEPEVVVVDEWKQEPEVVVVDESKKPVIQDDPKQEPVQVTGDMLFATLHQSASLYASKQDDLKVVIEKPDEPKQEPVMVDQVTGFATLHQSASLYASKDDVEPSGFLAQNSFVKVIDSDGDRTNIQWDNTRRFNGNIDGDGWVESAVLDLVSESELYKFCQSYPDLELWLGKNIITQKEETDSVSQPSEADTYVFDFGGKNDLKAHGDNKEKELKDRPGHDDYDYDSDQDKPIPDIKELKH